MNQPHNSPPQEPDILKKLEQEVQRLYESSPMTRLSEAMIIGIAAVLIAFALILASFWMY